MQWNRDRETLCQIDTQAVRVLGATDLKPNCFRAGSRQVTVRNRGMWGCFCTRPVAGCLGVMRVQMSCRIGYDTRSGRKTLHAQVQPERCAVSHLHSAVCLPAWSVKEHMPLFSTGTTFKRTGCKISGHSLLFKEGRLRHRTAVWHSSGMPGAAPMPRRPARGASQSRLDVDVPLPKRRRRAPAHPAGDSLRRHTERLS